MSFIQALLFYFITIAMWWLATKYYITIINKHRSTKFKNTTHHNHYSSFCFIFIVIICPSNQDLRRGVWMGCPLRPSSPNQYCRGTCPCCWNTGGSSFAVLPELERHTWLRSWQNTLSYGECAFIKL